MKILGISGSPRDETTSNCYRLVKMVLDSTGMEYELISLRGKVIRGCIACLGCVEDNVCVVKDDLSPLRDKIVKADAYVIGAPNYYSGINATTAALLERWFQFRHRTGDLLWGKLAVAVGVGGGNASVVVDRIEQIMGYNFIDTVAKISGQGTASCFSCGYGESCKVGVPYMLYGEGVKITEDMIPNISKQPQVLKAAEQAGQELAKRLASHNRNDVTKKMQKIMMEHFKNSV
jgi:multimeric flavodoxin WrbA